MINTRSIQTRFMDGNIDVDCVIFDLLLNEYGHDKLFNSKFDTDNAIYSNGFISAIEDGKIPMLELRPTDSHRMYNELEEYHHVIINEECYSVYFKNN